MVIPTVEQVRAALDAAPKEYRALVAVCAFAGLRLGEAAGLQIGDVDFLRRTLRVDRQVQGDNVESTRLESPKAGSERTIAIPKELADILARHISEIGTIRDESYFFFRGGDLLNRNSAGHIWREIRKAAKLPATYTLHTLRHFYASALISSGCDVVTVQRALGHSQPSITLNTYSHLWPDAEDRTRDAAATLMRSVLDAPADSLRTIGQV
nr:site-specific integrase [Brachybacterium fresconis]